MTLRIIPLLILTSLFLTSCGKAEAPAIVQNPVPKKVVSQKVTPSVLENSGSITVVQNNTGTTSTGGVKYEIINGIEVPPEPDPVLNNATLAGVDVNGNGVRDDVERYIAEKAKNNEIFKTDSETVRLTNLILISDRMSQKEMDVVRHDLNCIGLKGVKLGLTSDADILSLILNTQERSASYKLKTEGFGGGFFSINNSDCQI